MKERAAAIIRKMRIEDFSRAERCGQRKSVAGNAFGKAKNIRRGGCLFAGEHGARASPSCHHFIGDQQCSVLLRDPPELGEQARRIDFHSACTQNKRFQEQSGNLATPAEVL